MRYKYQVNNLIMKGFTLIELLVVISIIGVLIALSIFGLQGARQAARDARRKADIEQIRSGIEIFKADCDRYPGSLTSPLIGVPSYGTSCLATNTYIETIPADPIPSQNYSYTSDGTDYAICAHLEGDYPAVSGCGSCGSGVTCNYIVENP